MSENGENYIAGKKFNPAAGSDCIEKSHLCLWTGQLEALLNAQVSVSQLLF